MPLLLSILLTMGLVVAAAALHYEVLQWLRRGARPRGGRRMLLAMVLLQVAVHVGEIGLFAAGYWAGEHWLHLGRFAGQHAMAGVDYFYFASETYTSLGYGDIYPVGNLRLLAGANTLAGLLLMAWSGAFLFGLVEDWRRAGEEI